MKFDVIVFQEGHLWVVEIEPIGGVTQGFSEDHGITMAQAWFRDMLDDEGLKIDVKEAPQTPPLDQAKNLPGDSPRQKRNQKSVIFEVEETPALLKMVQQWQDLRSSD